LGFFRGFLPGVGIYLSHKWYQRAWSYDFNLHRSYFDPHIGNNYETFLLAVAVEDAPAKAIAMAVAVRVALVAVD
jgi:hypothetical protein